MPIDDQTEELEVVHEKKEQTQILITSLPSPPESDTGGDASSRAKCQRVLEKSVDQWWLWELLAWAVAVLAFLGIIILLQTRNHKPVPDWTIKTTLSGRTYETKITINAVISLFSTVLKSMIMIPVAAAISQLKWLWFHNGRNKLSDVQLFDAANRGPLGSIVLLWQMRGRQIVCLGAIIIITMLGLDFSFQSVVTYPLKSVTSPTAFVPAVATYTSVLSPWSAELSHTDSSKFNISACS